MFFFVFFFVFFCQASLIALKMLNQINLRETKNKVLISSCGCIHRNRLRVMCGRDFITLDCDQFRGWSAWNVENRVLSLHGTLRTLVNSPGLNR